MNNNNSVGIIVVGILGFIAIVIAGKWLLDDNHCKNGHCPPSRQMAPQYPNQYPNRPCPPQRPNHNEGVNINIQAPPAHFHNKNEFWFGYRDGYNGLPVRDNCPEYLSGYQMGVRDRRAGCHDYFDRHCPSGFQLRVPGFRLDIR
jgi:hypothetical protein